jgi:putative protease
MQKSSRLIHVPELIAPAGDWECARAAMENGADAVYFGLDQFNARMRAANFSLQDLPGLMEFLHLRGAKGYVTFNTLIFSDEIRDAAAFLKSIISAGCDAIIVQDIGIARLIRRLSPDVPMHASTQMTVSSAAGIAHAREIGCNRVILARECSIRDIERIRRDFDTDSGLGSPLPLEVFIHGALCVAYSGQCLTSEALGGRSANRGVCAQACRMAYDLIVDGNAAPLGDRRYLLSPRDLAGLIRIPELLRAGVFSFKIEGRLKSPEYVANITGIYRQAIDRIMAAMQLEDREPAEVDGARNLASELAAKSRYEMEMAFSRGLHTGWIDGMNHQELVHGRFSKKRGVFLGAVIRTSPTALWARLQGSLKPGDGIVFDEGKSEEQEQGGRVYQVEAAGNETRLEFGSGDVDLRRIQAGTKIWKTSDPELDRKLRHSFQTDQPRFRRPVHMIVRGQAGSPMNLEVDDLNACQVSVQSRIPLSHAQKQPLDEARLCAQFGRLGGTPFRLEKLENRLQADCILPISELNRMRREAVAQLCARRVLPRRWHLLPASEPILTSSAKSTNPPKSEISVLVRNFEQLEAVLALGVKTVVCDFEDPRKYREAVARFRNMHPTKSASIWVAPPRIFKPGEDWILAQVQACEADGYWVRNFDHLNRFRNCRMAGDYSLNVANALSAEHFITNCGLEWITPSYDLNVNQLLSLVRSSPADWFEITIHQHMPMFHMDHCVFCAFLSKGTNAANCGRPCERHQVRLRDRMGAEHGLKADAGCRNTIFNALAQTGAESMHILQEAGIRRFRLEFLDESALEVKQTVIQYQRLLRGEISGSELWRRFKLINQIGVTRGSMENLRTDS